MNAITHLSVFFRSGKGFIRTYGSSSDTLLQHVHVLNRIIKYLATKIHYRNRLHVETFQNLPFMCVPKQELVKNKRKSSFHNEN
jgi:hypothetical protein